MTQQKLSLYNTFSRTKEEFVPTKDGQVTMYVCGPTVYDYAHIGNARPAVIFDVLYRVLNEIYGKKNVKYARNITDIDDKINAAGKEAAQQQKISIEEAIKQRTEKYTTKYLEDMGALNVLAPPIQPKATETIPEIISFVKKLIEKGHAYEADGHVLFSIKTFKEYGQLSKKPQEDLIAGARVEVASYKKDAGDFILWKPSSDDLPGWKSPWGRGRPGWHIECSAMIEKYLGETIDIHGGGHDLIFPHHENEIAQSTTAHNGKTYVKYWLHNGMIMVDGKKMSKSLGNFLTVHDLLEQYNGEILRLRMLMTHYRKPLDWTIRGVAEAKATLEKIYTALNNFYDAKNPSDEKTLLDEKIDLPQEFMTALCDDLDTRQTIQLLQKYASELSKNASNYTYLIKGGAILGLFENSFESWKNKSTNVEKSLSNDEIQSLVKQRIDAKANKDYALADKIRDDLLAKGIVLKDTADGTVW